jgi:hypothetical protein
MKSYIYYSKFDSKQEPQGKLQAIDIEDATKIASHIKQMPVEDFLTVFTIEEWKKTLKK